MPRTRPRVLLPLVASLSALVVSGCGGSSAGAGTPVAGGSTSAAPATSSSSAPVASATPMPGTQRIAIAYKNGKVSGDSGRVDVYLKSVVTLVVTSDVADEVHLHGYDKSVDVPKNGTATLTFTANIPGVFEVELEKLKRRLVQLQVQA